MSITCWLTVTNIFIWQLYLFFHTYDHLCLPCLKDMLPGIIFCLHVCVQRCMLVWVYISIHAYMCPWRHECIYDGWHAAYHMYVCTYIHSYIQAYLCLPAYIIIHVSCTYISRYIYTYIDSCILSYNNMNVYLHKGIHTYMMHVYIHTYLSAYIHTYVAVSYIHAYLYMCVCIFICMYYVYRYLCI